MSGTILLYIHATDSSQSGIQTRDPGYRNMFHIQTCNPLALGTGWSLFRPMGLGEFSSQ